MARGLTGVSWSLLVAHSAWSLVLGLHMYKFWERRHAMKIFSRWPTMALLSGCAGIIVQASIVVQEIMAQEGKIMPCAIVLYLDAVGMVLYALPYLVRGLRAVVLSHNQYRRRFIKYFSRGRIAAFMTTAFVAVLGISAVLPRVSPQIYGNPPTEVCIYLGHWWFWGPVALAMILLGSKLFLELSRLNDRTNLASEVSSAAYTWLVGAVPYFLISVLHTYGVVEMPRQLGFILWMVMCVTLTSTFIIEPRRKRGESLCCKQEKVGVAVDDVRIDAWRKIWRNTEVIMSHPGLDKAYEKHARDFLCLESYHFIKEVNTYATQAGKKPVDDLFSHFRRIVDTFVLAGSELEINISNALRRGVLEIAGKAEFVEATLERQRDVLNPLRTEVLKLLDENIFGTFLTSEPFLASCVQWQEERDIEAIVSMEASLPSEEAGRQER